MKIRTIKKTLFFLFLISLNKNSALALERTDLEDRPRDVVVQKSLLLGETLPCCKTTGAILFNNGNLATAVAIDPFTILTAAHANFLQVEGAEIEFVLSTNAFGEYIKKQKKSFKSASYPIKPQNVHVHTGFRNVTNQELEANKSVYTVSFSKSVSSLEKFLEMQQSEALPLISLGDIPVTALENFQFEDVKNTFLGVGNFRGIDLAILKLTKPLPKDLSYPAFVAEDYQIEQLNGLSVGFGELLYNDNIKGPHSVTNDIFEKHHRHVVSCKVSSTCLEENNMVLYGNYKGSFIHGDRSFIPTDDMLKTAGLPVGGDSGGPFFIDINGTYKLCGIFSQILAPFTNSCETEPLKSLLKDVKQPIFPIWQDIRPYLPWIQSLMG